MDNDLTDKYVKMLTEEERKKLYRQFADTLSDMKKRENRVKNNLDDRAGKLETLYNVLKLKESQLENRYREFEKIKDKYFMKTIWKGIGIGVVVGGLAGILIGCGKPDPSIKGKYYITESKEQTFHDEGIYTKTIKSMVADTYFLRQTEESFGPNIQEETKQNPIYEVRKHGI